jgi:hypothetical protein
VAACTSRAWAPARPADAITLRAALRAAPAVRAVWAAWPRWLPCSHPCCIVICHASVAAVPLALPVVARSAVPPSPATSAPTATAATPVVITAAVATVAGAIPCLSHVSCCNMYLRVFQR